MTVEALRRGRPEVLATLLDEYGREIQGVAYLILRDRAAAEDVLIDTLVTALDRGAQLRDPAALRAWLLRIATNHALGWRRKGAHVVYLHVLPDIQTRSEWPDQADRTALWESVSALPPRMRAVVVLRYYADLPVEGVATTMGISPNTVKTQLKTALQHLRAAMADSADVADVAAEIGHA
jgi:RNA polymerase sigma-70 factor (ECF subfamily)